MTVTLTWHPLDPPRPPVAVLATGTAATALAAATARSRERGLPLRAAAADDDLLVLGPADALPWVDDATYLGEEAGLLLPTTLAPNVPPDLLRHAVRAVVPTGATAVLPGRILGFTASDGPVDLAWLRTWAAVPVR
ncbi:hypothetical protein F9L07_00295 [Pimelobacter simplex]|uniref:MoxR-vWA-beta-propeller ternary system domain-containing protein n=1 Tax=Nocardioides simplex TaxID=2045 RepID=A0A7J5DX52_NOCSI|nr:hypothetical protein [Pimelobacter simplex]KAB2810458.1 hypothetical protein F9L07_00295 [Pimelobacter simplex]